MKYFTKQWYQTNQCTGMHVLLESSDRAAIFSEEYFRELYELRVQERIETMQRVQAVDMKALAAAFADESARPTHVDGSPVSEQDAEFVDAFRTSLIESLQEAPPFVFDPEEERKTVHLQYLSMLEHLERCLPKETRAKVADLRVLALNHATQEIIDEIAAFSQSCSAIVNRAYDLYRQDYKNNFSDEKPAFFREFDLHDARILSVRREDRDLVFTFKENFFWRFRDAEFILCEEPIEQCYWLIDEIYPTENGGYELHAMLEEISESGDIRPREFILQFQDAETGVLQE